MAIGKSIISKLGKAARFSGAVGNRLSGRGAMAAIGGTAFMAGVANKAGPAAMDATMEAAFGDANADRYFTGRDLSLRTMVGGYLGGNIGGAMRLSSPGDYMATDPTSPIPGAIVGTSIGTLAGGVIGNKILGKKIGGKAGAVVGALSGGLVAGGAAAESVTNSSQVAYGSIAAGGILGLIGGAVGGVKLGSKKGIIGGVGGAIIGGGLGGALGATAGTAVTAAGPITYMRNNEQFFSQSPYSPARTNSGNLNATGEIVLGMHNSRRGY